MPTYTHNQHMSLSPTLYKALQDTTILFRWLGVPHYVHHSVYVHLLGTTPHGNSYSTQFTKPSIGFSTGASYQLQLYTNCNCCVLKGVVQ